MVNELCESTGNKKMKYQRPKKNNPQKRTGRYNYIESKVREEPPVEYISYRDQLISRINNGGDWSDTRFAREELEEYEERLRDDEERGSW